MNYDLDYDKVIAIALALQAEESPDDTVRGFYERTILARRVVKALGKRLTVAQEAPAPKPSSGSDFQRLNFRWWLDGVEQSGAGAVLHQGGGRYESNYDGWTTRSIDALSVTTPENLPWGHKLMMVEIRRDGRVTTLVGDAEVTRTFGGSEAVFRLYHTVSVVNETN